MNSYIVGLNERHIFWSVVKAENEEDAIELARNGLGEVDCDWSEYVETLDVEPIVKRFTDVMKQKGKRK